MFCRNELSTSAGSVHVRTEHSAAVASSLHEDIRHHSVQYIFWPDGDRYQISGPAVPLKIPIELATCPPLSLGTSARVWTPTTSPLIAASESAEPRPCSMRESSASPSSSSADEYPRAYGPSNGRRAAIHLFLFGAYHRPTPYCWMVGNQLPFLQTDLSVIVRCPGNLPTTQ